MWVVPAPRPGVTWSYPLLDPHVSYIESSEKLKCPLKYKKKSRIRETPTLSTDADSRTDTIFQEVAWFIFKMLTRFTPEPIPVFRALLKIKIDIELRNTSSFLGLYSRLRSRLISRSNSGTHPRFKGSTRDQDQDQDWTPEHILVFRALLEIEIEIAPVHGRGTLCTSPTTQKIAWEGDQQTNTQTHRHTHRLFTY